jgi:hypothetical protein
MAPEPSGTEVQQPMSEPVTLQEPTVPELLLEQYKVFEERRKYFGSQFMQTIGGVTAIFTVLVGLLGGKTENRAVLRITLVVGGIAFLLLAFLGFRLGQRQDDCEDGIREIESHLESIGYTRIVKMRKGPSSEPGN